MALIGSGLRYFARHPSKPNPLSTMFNAAKDEGRVKEDDPVILTECNNCRKSLTLIWSYEDEQINVKYYRFLNMKIDTNEIVSVIYFTEYEYNLFIAFLNDAQYETRSYSDSKGQRSFHMTPSEQGVILKQQNQDSSGEMEFTRIEVRKMLIKHPRLRQYLEPEYCVYN